MRSTAKQLRRGVFGAAVVMALGFGGSQALASPAPRVDAAPKCDPRLCDRICRAIGAFSGTCTEGGGCACAL
ncbi:MAG TPA: hypothetical protein VFT45_16685 [Longimicrobium sp.]|nr:hypothetical protein [Longimicrobium sp.]